MKHLLIILAIMSHHWLQAQNPVIIYIGDPLCSWCYGIAPELDKLRDSLPDHDFKLVLGGLRPGGTETNAELGDFLREHWQEVHKRTQQPFNYDILERPDMQYDTEPACRAVITARLMKVADEMAFFKAVQHAFYVLNQDPNDVQTFLDIAADFDLDPEEFQRIFESGIAREATVEDFALSTRMGVKGFPTIVARHDAQLYMIANGYSTADQMLEILKKIQDSIN